jgi:hypothetical protein
MTYDQLPQEVMYLYPRVNVIGCRSLAATVVQVDTVYGTHTWQFLSGHWVRVSDPKDWSRPPSSRKCGMDSSVGHPLTDLETILQEEYQEYQRLCSKSAADYETYLVGLGYSDEEARRLANLREK